MGEELLGLEGNEEDVDLLREEALEGSHEHLEFEGLRCLFRLRDELLGRGDGTLFLVNLFLDDAAVLHVDDTVGVDEVLGVVRHQDDGLLVDLVQFLQDLEHVLGALGIEVADRLVRENDVGIVDERTGDGDALLLSAGELVGELVRLLDDAEPSQERDTVLAAFLGGFASEDLGQADVVEDVERGDEIEGLEDHADPGLMKLQFFRACHF